MKNMKRVGILCVILIMALIAGCNGSKSTTGEKSEASSGGTLKIAIGAQPPTMDTHLTTTSIALDITRNIYETLVTQNGNQQPVPMLAESIEKSDDGLSYTFKLRTGVKFHNGKEMTSEDVVASMNRWLEQSARAKLLLSGSTFEAVDESTVVLKMQNVASDVLDIMAGRGQFPAIYPKEVIEGAGPEGITEYIGTGPFKFGEWKQDQYIRLEKFDDYSALDGEPDGTAGKKEALVDEVYFYVVNDPSTRMAGIQTGEYDVAIDIPFDSYEQLKEDPSMETYVSFDAGTVNVSYNKKEGIFTNPAIRKAVNQGVNSEEVMLASFGSKDLYRLSPSYMNVDQVDWANDKGKEAYNIADPEKAKQMLKEAGYNGEEVVLYSTRDYDHHYNAAVVLKGQLEKMGMKVKLELYDWPTLTEKREDPKNWDLLIVGTGYVTTPSQLLVVNPDYVGWTNDEKLFDMLGQIRTAPSKEEAKALWENLQEYIWKDYVPYSLFGHYPSIMVTTNKLEGFKPFQGVIPWNVKVNK